MRLFWIALLLLLTILANGCANKVEVPKDINVHSDPVKVEISPVVITMISSIASNPDFQSAVATACQGEAQCTTTSTTDILNAIASTLAQVAPQQTNSTTGQ